MGVLAYFYDCTCVPYSNVTCLVAALHSGLLLMEKLISLLSVFDGFLDLCQCEMSPLERTRCSMILRNWHQKKLMFITIVFKSLKHFLCHLASTNKQSTLSSCFQQCFCKVFLFSTNNVHYFSIGGLNCNLHFFSSLINLESICSTV